MMGTDLSSNGMSKNVVPFSITLSNSSSGTPTFLRYKNPTSISACRSCFKNSGFVAGSSASERSNRGIVVNDMASGVAADWKQCFKTYEFDIDDEPDSWNFPLDEGSQMSNSRCRHRPTL